MIVGLLLMTAGVFLLAFAPAQFEATARVAVETPPSGSTNATAGHDPLWVQREIKRIASSPVLRTAITNLHLDREWAEQQKHEGPLEMAETERQLKERMGIHPGRGAALIEVSTWSYGGSEAALLANAIAEAFRSTHARDAGKVEIVEAATPPTKPRRQKNPLAVILFLGGAMLMVAGYVWLRPHLASPTAPLRP